MLSPVTIALYSDVHCPYAYVTAYRLRQLRAEYRGRVVISYKSLALEYVNRRSTPKPILDNETPILMLEEPEIPYQPWHAPLSEWPVTMWPAFEAVAHTLVYDGTIMGDTQRGHALPAERVASVKVPTLVIVGAASPVWALTSLRALVDLLPDAQLRTLAGEFHAVSPQILAPALEEFFHGVSPVATNLA